jgi:hypothetical protein
MTTNSTDVRFLFLIRINFDCDDVNHDTAALTQPLNLVSELQQDPLGTIQDVPGRGAEQAGRRAAPADTGLGLGAGGKAVRFEIRMFGGKAGLRQGGRDR